METREFIPGRPYEEYRRHRRRWGRLWPFLPGLLLGVAATLAVAAPILSQARNNQAETQDQLAQLQQAATGLAADLRAFQTQVEQAQDRIASAQKELGAREQELQALKTQSADGLSKAEVAEMARKLDADRLLLVEQRKGDPDIRQEALQYWANVRRVAGQADPTLPVKVDAVIQAAPAYFDWREHQFASSEEEIQAYYLTDAIRYTAASQDFWSSATLVVINRLDTLISLMER